MSGRLVVNNTTSTAIETVGAYDAAIADLNNDGYQDLIFACYQNYSDYEIPSVAFYGHANGFNSTPDDYFPTNGSAAVAASDLNNDGWVDIAFACEEDNNNDGNIKSQVYYGGPSGFNSTPDQLLPSQAAFGIAISDLNLDGWDDINRKQPQHLALPSRRHPGPQFGLLRRSGRVQYKTGRSD